MKRISKILKNDNFIPEMGYLVFTPNGMSVFNGQVGIHYSRKVAGEKLCSLADEHGPYGIPNPVKFLKTITVLENVSSVELIASESAITVKYAGRGVIKIPVVLGLNEAVPHLNIDWVEFPKAKAEGLPITSTWAEVLGLTTNEGEALWANAIGLYGSKGRLISFDYGIYLQSNDTEMPDFYCPRLLLDLGLIDVQYAISHEGNVHLVGPEVQYVCMAVTASDVVDEMLKIKDDFDGGQMKNVTLSLSSGLWKRAKLFSGTVLKLRIKDGDMFVEHDTWSEVIGKTDAPDSQFTTRISLLSRWASGTFQHQIAITPEGEWHLSGKTRAEVKFYAVLTDVQNPFNDEDTKDGTLPESIADEIDIEPGKSLLG